MRIVHIGASRSVDTVNGVNMVVWLLASAQASAGHRVGLVLPLPPDARTRDFAEQHRLDLTFVDGKWYLPGDLGVAAWLQAFGTEIVHFHSVFTPWHARIAATLRARHIPYVITPHGGLAPATLARGSLKKRLYAMLIERRRMRHAAAIISLAAAESSDIAAFLPDYPGDIPEIENPVPPPPEFTRAEPTDRPYLLYLGRFGVEQKGMDLAIELARRLPGLDFRMHGRPDPFDAAHLTDLVKAAPGNIAFLPPVFGAAKWSLLAGATAYLQPSRTDASPVSVAEALLVGTPVIATRRMYVSEKLAAASVGVMIDVDPDIAAGQIQEFLADRALRVAACERARGYARQAYDPRRAAARHIEAYAASLHRLAGRRRLRALGLDRAA